MALAPDDTEVQALFVDILDNPPKTPPPELLEILDQTSREAQRRILPRAALAYSCSMLLFFPLQVLIGIRSWTLTLVPLALWMTAGALAWVAYKKDHTGPRVFPYVTLAAAVALAATSVLHGPLLVVPAIGAVIAMGMALQRHPRDRKVSTALNLLAVLVPTGLAWAGLHPVHHEFVNGDMVIHPGALELPRDATFVILSGVHVLVIGLAAMFAGNYRDSLTQIELKSQMIAWQLRQLAPVRGAGSGHPDLPGKD
jgi:hypothetical protein